MADSSSNVQLGIFRSAAVVSLGLVSLAGSLAAALCQRILTVPTDSGTVAPRISKLVMDEWEAELARLDLPSRHEVVTMQQQLAGLEAQIDQLLQHTSQPKEED